MRRIYDSSLEKIPYYGDDGKIAGEIDFLGIIDDTMDIYEFKGRKRLSYMRRAYHQLRRVKYTFRDCSPNIRTFIVFKDKELVKIDV